MQETIGRRIARLRQESGWTQQRLAARLAISRVAVSQIEMDLTIPSERTITLLAGLFKRAPQALVEATTYPLAKAERLPEVACCYTALEYNLALLDNDLAWVRRLADCPEAPGLAATAQATVQAQWSDRMDAWSEQATDACEKDLLREARQKLNTTTKGA